MNRKIAATLTTLAASAVAITGVVAASPAANAEAAQSAPQKRTTIAFSARTDHILTGLHVKTSPTGNATLTVKASQPSALGLPVLRQGPHRVVTSGGVRFRTADANLVFGHWGFNTTNRDVNAVINKSARATFFKLKRMPNRPAGTYKVVFNNIGAGNFNTILDTQSFHVGDTFGVVRLPS